MLKFLLLLTPCAIAGYVAYPYVNGMEEANFPNFNVGLLNKVENHEVIGAWALSPRSTGLLSNVAGTSGKRLGLSLESWGGGQANFTMGERRIEGPISWDLKPGKGLKPATLLIRSGHDQIELKFSNLDENLTLVAEADTVIPGKTDHIRFLRAGR